MTYIFLTLALISPILFFAYMIEISKNSEKQIRNQERIERLQRELRHYKNLYSNARKMWEIEKNKNL